MTDRAATSVSSTPLRTCRTQYAARSSSSARGRYSPARSADTRRRAGPGCRLPRRRSARRSSAARFLTLPVIGPPQVLDALLTPLG